MSEGSNGLCCGVPGGAVEEDEQHGRVVLHVLDVDAVVAEDERSCKLREQGVVVALRARVGLANEWSFDAGEHGLDVGDRDGHLDGARVLGSRSAAVVASGCRDQQDARHGDTGGSLHPASFAYDAHRTRCAGLAPS